MYQQIHDLQKLKAQQGGLTDSQSQQLKALLRQYNLNLHMQEVLWKQKSRTI